MANPAAPGKKKAPKKIGLRKLRAEQVAKLAWSYVDDGNPKDALPLLQMAVELEPNNDEYWAALGMAHARALQPSQAIQAFERALSLRPDSPQSIDLWCSVGELSLDRFDYKLAAQALSKCLALDPEAAHPSGVRARALIRKAQKQLEKQLAGR